MAGKAKNSLLDDMDAAASHLLKSIGIGDTLTEDERAKAGEIPVTEKAKVFQTVQAWVEKRAALIPKKEVKGKFDGIRDEFLGASAQRGRGRAAKANGVDETSDLDGGGADDGTESERTFDA